jgi:SAM-dependent methyltransferase
MNIKQLLYGLSTFVPGLAHFHAKGTGGSCSARYCYSVWLRHLTLAHKNGLFKSLPQSVGELGPGDSIGIGIAALLSGVKNYYGLDIVEHASLSGNLEIFQNLIPLFKNKEPIPNEKEFPNLKPVLENYDFPEFILNYENLEKSLASENLQQIEDSIKNPDKDSSLIKYSAPWQSSEKIQKSSLDWIFSQAVLEHIDELELTYESMKSWLKPDGFISHQIDFKCHGLTKEWNGHWAMPEYFCCAGKDHICLTVSLFRPILNFYSKRALN